MNKLSVALLLLVLVAAPVRADTPEQNATAVANLLDDDPDAALAQLAQLSDLDRFRTLRVLDRSNSTTVRKIYDALDEAGRTKLLDLVKASGAAGTKAGEQQLGVVSDVDDTAVPTEFTPDGAYSFKGSGDFYRMLALGTDGKGDPGNLHFVSARPPAFWPDTKVRLEAAGLPLGTFDGDSNIGNILGGLDGIQRSKIENLDLWLKLHPGQRFVFLGDSLQRDPEVYEWVVQHYPSQVEAVLIHKAGGPQRDPAAFKGETFFVDYPQASQIVKDRGIPQPGARLVAPAEDPNITTNTDVSQIHGDNFFNKIGNFFKENFGALFKHHAKGQPVVDDDVKEHAPSRSSGMTSALEQRVQESAEPARAEAP